MMSSVVPQTMRAAIAREGTCMILSDAPVPMPAAGEVLIRVHYSAINRADTLQRRGQYPPPPGAPETLGLEVAGNIVTAASGAAGDGGFAIGERVMALLVGGGNAEFVAAPLGQLMRVPASLDWRAAAAIPETWLTAYQLLHFVGKAAAGEIVVIHAAASGVGTAAVQLAIGAGCRVVAVSGSDSKLAAVRALAERTTAALHATGRKSGALVAGINYKSTEDWAAAVHAASAASSGAHAPHGAALVLDPVGGSFWKQNVEALALDGRWVLYGCMGGGSVDGALLALAIRKRLTLTATTLRSRSLAYKADLTRAFVENALPLLESGAYTPVVDREFRLDELNAAHAFMESNASVGKIVIKVA